jgi:hypothetical protein
MTQNRVRIIAQASFVIFAQTGFVIFAQTGFEDKRYIKKC